MTSQTGKAEAANQAILDELAPVHYRAYQEVAMLRQGLCPLDELELQALGDVSGKRLLHLQCHIGTDTLAWARRGAVVTGVDFSRESLDRAEKLRDELGLEAAFVQANVYDLPQVLEGQFDIVYTSRGVLCWLRDLGQWARIAAHYLAPGGTFYLMDAHPLSTVLEENADGQLVITNRYFGDGTPTCWDDEPGDYADSSYTCRNPSYEWEWSLGEIVTAVISAGLQLERLEEHERLFFKRWAGMVEHSPRWFHCPDYTGSLPLLFTLQARKPG